MARIRTIKPEFFRSRSLSRCPPEARLTFAGLWTEADDHGRGIADPRILKGAIWPLDDDVTHQHVSAHLDVLAATGHIRLYEVAGEAYYEVVNWTDHQAAAYRRGEPRHPAPQEGVDDSSHPGVQESADRTETRAGTGNREQGTGEPLGDADAPPSSNGRQRDVVFEAVAEACGIDLTRGLGKSARGSLNGAVRDLRQMDATPTEVAERAATYRRRFPDAALTPPALAKHWPSLGGAPPDDTVGPGELAARRRQQALNRGGALAAGGVDRIEAMRILEDEWGHDRELADLALDAYEHDAGGMA